MEKIKVTGCGDCPACQPNDMAGGFSCNLKPHPNNFINEDRFMSPVTPKWCPLKTSPILLVNDNTTHFDSYETLGVFPKKTDLNKVFGAMPEAGELLEEKTNSMEKDIKIAMQTLENEIHWVYANNRINHHISGIKNAFEELKVLIDDYLNNENDSNSAPSDEALLLAEHNPMDIQPKDFWVKKPIKDLNDKSLKEGDYVKYDFELYVFKCWGYDSVILIDMKGNEKEIPWY